MTSRRVCIINPRAGGGAVERTWPDVARRLRQQWSFEELRTSRPGEATALTRTAIREGAEVVIACGGDGTLNEVVNGFFDGERPVGDACLGILPVGTGGDFRRTLSLARDPLVVATELPSMVARAIDVGRVEFEAATGAREARIFVNIASAGLSGVVDRLVNEPLHVGGRALDLKRLGGRASFALATVRAAVAYSGARVRVTVDGDRTRELEVSTVVIANGRYFGAGMHVAPMARVDDGLLEVVCLPAMGPIELFKNAARIYQGTHLELEGVVHERGTQIEIESLGTAPLELDVDGEAPGTTPARFRVLPGALRLLSPPLL